MGEWRHNYTILNLAAGRDAVQAVSCRISTARAWIRSRDKSCGGQSARRAGFSEYLSFPFHSFVPIIINHPGLIQ
jgi:hypothetical protein